MTRSLLRTLFIALTLTLAGCASAERDAPWNTRTPAPLFEGLGTHTRTVSTSSADAQRYFNQGLVWAYAFNHDEAIRAFHTAALRDPDCAMAWWGVALCHGPHINNPMMDAARSKAAWAAVQQAQAKAGQAREVERELIDAVAKRYASPPPADRRPLDEAYAAAMGEVWARHRDDADIGVLYAEALMDLQPWDLWTSAGEPKGRTTEIVAVLEEVLAKHPEHPGACHLYVHACEASPHPEKADASAAVLRTAVPAAGHLVHMPAHIDVQLGRWSLAADQNVAAVESDRHYRQISPRQGFYRIYMAHNHHFLAFASMMEGRSQAALAAAHELIAGVPAEFVRDNGAMIDPYLAIKLDVLKRFGRWDDILKEPRPLQQLPITTAMWFYARGVAYAAKGEIANAEREQTAFRKAVENVPADALMAINSAHHVLKIADHMLAGELTYRRGDIDAAVAELRTAVSLEDELRYMEPPEWIQPVRHTLGAILVSAKRFKEAEEVYRRDLEVWPENGWSLHGLAQCLEAQGKASEAEPVGRRFAKVWHRADVKIGSSCLCVPGKARAAAGERCHPTGIELTALPTGN